MFEAHNICRELLSHRLLQHNVDLPKPQAFLTDLSLGSSPRNGSDESIANRRTVQMMHEISRNKCNELTGEILKIVRKHVGSTFFRYDASLVRGGRSALPCCLVVVLISHGSLAQTAHTMLPCCSRPRTVPKRISRSASRRCPRCAGDSPRLPSVPQSEHRASSTE